MGKNLTVEVTVWINKDLQLTYIENRVVDSLENLVWSHLDVKTFEGDIVEMDDVDLVPWVYVSSCEYTLPYECIPYK